MQTEICTIAYVSATALASWTGSAAVVWAACAVATSHVGALGFLLLLFLNCSNAKQQMEMQVPVSCTRKAQPAGCPKIQKLKLPVRSTTVAMIVNASNSRNLGTASHSPACTRQRGSGPHQGSMGPHNC